MRRFWQRLAVGAVAVVAVPFAVGTTPASAAGVAQNGVVDVVPGADTPHILDGTVHDIAQVGNRIVVAGSFTQVQQSPVNGGAAVNQPYVFAFDPANGRIDTAFDPVVNNDVRAIQAGPNNTVYIGGVFNSVNGQTGTGVRRLAQLSLATGDRVGAFTTPNINAGINDLVLVNDRLLVGGVFTTVGGAAYGGLVALNPTTGARTNYLGVDVTLNHNWPDRGGVGQAHARAAVGVDKFDVTPDGTRMIAIGNFRHADGLERDQAVLINLGATSASVAPNWRTRGFEATCYFWSFDSYVRDVQFSPDGSYFSVVTSGGGNPGTLCDTLTRWETSATGDDVRPTWAAYSGGDSLFSVEITGSAIYTGGHHRWMNNNNGRDFASAGAVPRAGISAHDPRTGVPLAWNPGRHPRGVGAEAMLATTNGLYVGMDTPFIGNRQYLRPGLAFFPLAGGSTAPAEATGSLPANVYLGGPRSAVPAAESGDVLFRVNAGGPEVPATDGGPAWTADDGADNPLRTSGGIASTRSGAFTIDGTVPSTTPAAVFDDDRQAVGSPMLPGFPPSQSWSFPVASGTTVDVRLYLADRDPVSTALMSRLFVVLLEGQTRLSFFDINGDVGHDVGTMKSFRATIDDGVVDLDFGTLLGNPIVSAIEIVESAPGTPAPIGVDDVLSRWFDGTTAATDQPAPTGGLEWSRARGAFMAGNQLFYGYPGANGDYYLHKRTFDGASFGDATVLDPYNDPAWSDLATGTWWFDVIPNFYRGMVPTFYGQLPTVSSMVFENGRLYYTRTGFAGLYSRPFSVDSGIVGQEERVQVASGWNDVSGAFLSGGRFWWASASTGELRSAPWNNGSPNPAASEVEDSSRSWASRALFVGPGGPPVGVNQPPTADIAASCAGLTCTFSSAGSSDPDGTITGRTWAFGDGSTSTQTNPSKTYASPGDYQVTLTVTDNSGASTTATESVSVAAGTTGIAQRAATGTSARSVTSVSVAIPAAVQAGDGLVLVLSTNSTASGATPAGWTAVHSRLSGSGPNTQVFSRVAQAGDAGDPVNVTLSARAKVTLQLVAYSGTSTTAPIASVTSTARPAGTSHPTPASTAAAGSWVVSVWSDKQSAARTWTAPAGVTVRDSRAGVGSGDVATLVADNGPVAAGAVPSRTATVPTASNRATTMTIVLAPGSGGPPPATGIALRGAEGTSARAVTSVSVDVPAAVQAGDGMVLVLSTNSTVTGAAPAGWTQVGGQLSGSGPNTQVFQRVAAAGDAGDEVTVQLSARAKVTLQLMAYSGTAAADPVASVAGLARAAGTSHPTPGATAAAGNWVLSVWSDKGSAARTWTAPGGVDVRSNLAGVGSGDVATLVADQGPVAGGAVGNLTATVPTSSTRAATLTIVLAAG